MLLKDLPYGRWFTISNSPDSQLGNLLLEYVFLKTNTGVAISDDPCDLFNVVYGTVALKRYYGARCDFFFDFGFNTEVKEVRVDFRGILNSSEKHVKIKDLKAEVKELDVLSVSLPNQTKNKLLLCLYKQDDEVIIVDYESGLLISNNYLQYLINIGMSNNCELSVVSIATIENYTIEEID